jgi:hypothetical protein
MVGGAAQLLSLGNNTMVMKFPCHIRARLLLALAMVQACLMPLVSAASTNAVIAYKDMDKMCQIGDGLDQTKFEARVIVFSTNSAVHRSDIRLTIQSTNRGAIPLQISTNGQVLNFPHDKELLRENPPIIANQPAGTLSLTVKFELAIPEDLTFRYSRLGDGLAEANKMMKSMVGMWSLLVPKMNGVIFYFPKASAGKAKIEIMRAEGVKEYTADTNSMIEFKIERKLLTENPEVKVSEKPRHILPGKE